MNVKKTAVILVCLLICDFAFALGSGDESLMTWWKMDDGSGTIAVDSAYNMDGTIGSENTWISNSLYFPGQDFNNGASKVGCDESIFNQISDEITITFWAKNDMPNCRGNCYFFTAEIDGSRALQIDLTGNPTANLMFKAADTDNSAWIRGAWDPDQQYYTDPNVWNYYSFTKNATTGIIKIYVNGQLLADFAGATTSMAGIDSFEICGNSANENQWAGWVKDFRIYNKEFNSEQINILKKQYVPSLIAWYKFDETSGITIADSSGNGFDATCNFDTYYWDSNGGYDGSGCLDNNSTWRNQKVTVPPEAFSTIDEQITVMFWTQNHHPGLADGNWFQGNAGGSQMIAASGGDYFIYAASGSGSSFNWDYRANTTQDLWHHIAVTFDSGSMCMYLNGEYLWHSTPNPLPGDSIDGIDEFYIGASSSSDWWDSFHGKMDDFRIYDKALNYLEIIRIIKPDTFVGDFNFDTAIDGKDLELLANNWLESGNYIIADADNDKDVDMADYASLANNYTPSKWDKPGWTLTFHDEFDGNEVDSIKWGKEVNVFSVDNGSLKVHIVDPNSDHASESIWDCGGGSLDTAGKLSTAFGYIECSAKLPVGDGTWPAIFFIPALPGGTWWPNAEIDIMEHIYSSNSAGNVAANIHWNNYREDHVCWTDLFPGNDTVYTFNPASTAFDDFHVYAMKWEPGAIFIYVDGYNYVTLRDEDVPDHMYNNEPASYNPDNIKVPTNPETLVLGAGLAPWVTPNVETEAIFEVDYIRVYKKNE